MERTMGDITQRKKHDGEEEVNLGRVFIGVLLVSFGLVIFARYMGWLPVSRTWIDVSKIWPLVIIAVGFSLVRVKGWMGIVLGITVAVWAIAFVGLLTAKECLGGWF